MKIAAVSDNLENNEGLHTVKTVAGGQLLQHHSSLALKDKWISDVAWDQVQATITKRVGHPSLENRMAFRPLGKASSCWWRDLLLRHVISGRGHLETEVQILGFEAVGYMQLLISLELADGSCEVTASILNLGAEK